MRIILLGLLLALTAPSYGQSTKVERTLTALLDRQAAAWNAGDLEGFMAGYWRSPELQFIGSRGLTTGWRATLENYRKSYPGRAAMGTLSFEVLDVSSRGKKVATVVGKWRLQRAADAPGGHFLLVCQKIKGRWVIVADHSS